MKIALIMDGVVRNTIICESVLLAEELFPDYEIVGIDGVTAGVGWSFDGERFAAPIIVKTPEEQASENLTAAQSEYERATFVINELNEQIADSDYAGTTEAEVSAALISWTDYRKQLRAYIKTGDGRLALPVVQAM